MYIGVDCGTQSTKVVVVDVERGVILGEGSRPHRLDEGEQGLPEVLRRGFRAVEASPEHPGAPDLNHLGN